MAKRRNTKATRSAGKAKPPTRPRSTDTLMVMSVKKAFRVLEAFGRRKQTLSLSQVAADTGMHVSAAQRFTYTLTRLGYPGRTLRRSVSSSRRRTSIKATAFFSAIG